MVVDSSDVRPLPVERLIPFAFQSRELFDDASIRSLADDILARGQLQAGLAWEDVARGQFVLICGERRWRAIKLAGLPTMAVKVITGELSQSQLLAINLSENLNRENLNPIERAKAFRRLMQLDSLTASQVAETMHCSNATVSRDLSLLELSPELQSQVISGELIASVGSMISRLKDPDIRRELADRYINGTLGRDGVAAEVNERLKKPGKAKPPSLACSIGPLSIVISSAKPVSWETLLPAIERLLGEATQLRDGGKPINALPRLLKAVAGG